MSDNKAASSYEQPKELVLHPDLRMKLDDYRKYRKFNPEEWVLEDFQLLCPSSGIAETFLQVNMKCKMFNEYMSKWGLKAAVVSVSGGVDSAVTLALMKRSSMMPDSPIKRIMGIAQPILSSDWALNRGRCVLIRARIPLL